MSDIEVHIDLNGTTRPIGIAHANQARGGETVVFEYLDTWLDDAERFSIEPALALTRGGFAPPRGQTIFGSLGDSAPDTWGRRLMQRAERRLADQENRQVRTLTETDYFGALANMRFKHPFALAFRPLSNWADYSRSQSASYETKKQTKTCK